MNCRTFHRRWQSLLDERLLPQEDSELLEHAWNCEHCQQLLNGQQDLFSLITSDAPPAPSPNLADRIVAKVRMNKPAHSLVEGDRRAAVWMWIAVAASLLLVVSPVALWFRGQHQPNPNSFVKQLGPPANHLENREHESWQVAINQQDFIRVLDVITRIREQDFDPSVDSITDHLRPITASFEVTLDALRKTLPLPNKGNEQKPQADARDLDIFA
jgi:hypothetical protein